jgi:4-hydroxy-2-oxoheptanedioate aldolase
MINPLKQRLADDKANVGILITMPSVNMAQALAACGFDWLFIDMEHGPIDIGSCHHLITATAGTNCAPVVRVPEPSITYTKPVLDSGAMGLVFPMVLNAEIARQCVRATRYPPKGERGWGPFYAPYRWGVGNAMAYHAVADEVVIIALIEHIEAVRNIDEIVAVEGIDVCLIAPMDLAVSMGHPGDRDHPEVVAAIATAEKAILGSGKALGGMALTTEETNAKIERGYRVFVGGFDVMLVETAARQLLDGVNR